MPGKVLVPGPVQEIPKSKCCSSMWCFYVCCWGVSNIVLQHCFCCKSLPKY
jgi:hypothetical protein